MRGLKEDSATMATGVTRKIRAPFKWAGGKYQILDNIRSLLPPGKRLIEPFVGSGVVFLNTEFDRYLLNDKNKDLITFYKILKKEKDAFIDYCGGFFNAKNNISEEYYEFRDQFNHTDDLRLKSALFLYLNKHGYNGLCRYNSSGNFNVPFGRYKKPYFPEKEMRHFLKKCKRATIQSKDFESVMRTAKKGDVVYCDPPYVPLSRTSNFTAYSAGGFGPDEQRRLAKVAQEISEEGIPVLISNHSTSFTKSLYSKAERNYISVRRLISCNGSKREHAKEILALYLPTGQDI
jgi:DNA adenine methylase